VAQRRGWRERGLDVTIQFANGSTDAIAKVAAGAGHFALADTSAVIVARGNRGAPVRLVSMYHYKNLMAELTLTKSGISRPVDLEHTVQQSTAGDATLVLLPALAKLNGFDATKVRVQPGLFPTTVPNILAGHVDGALTYYTLFPALKRAAERAGKVASYFLYADYGLDVYNNGIVTTEHFIDSDPNLIRDFNTGLVEAVEFSVQDPHESVRMLMEQVPGLDADIALAQLEIALDHLNVAEVRDHGFGPIHDAKMTKTLDVVNSYFDLTTPVLRTSDVYTNAMVPFGRIPRFTSVPQ
jgi:NitT/TauT family transport system substrate-binding protein